MVGIPIIMEALDWDSIEGAFNNVTQSTEGTLFIDLIDASKKELAWQGMGTGALVTSKTPAKKEERIKEFVTEILAKYPPGTE